MISALILAAGQSKRMGRPKMSLPWGASTVLGQVIQTFRAAPVDDILVVTGADAAAVEQIAESRGARTVYNPDFATDDMLRSMQTGLRAMGPEVEAALIALGDQPQMQASTVLAILQKYSDSGASLIVPSYQMRRGHPWLVARTHWDTIFRMHPPETPRDFLSQHARDITYLLVDTPTILQDIDTPDEYERGKQGGSF